MSSKGTALSVAPEDVRRYIADQLVPIGAESVWLVGSRSRRLGKVPRPDSDWDIEVMGNVQTPLPAPPDFGVFGEVHAVREIKREAIQLYPKWEYTE